MRIKSGSAPCSRIASSAIRDLETLQRRLLELIFTVTPAERDAILLADSGAEDFASVFGLHRSGRPEKSVSVSRSIAQRVMREGVGVLSAGVADDASPQSLHGAGAQSALAAPLTTSVEVFGVVYLETTDPSAGFDSDHLQLVNAIEQSSGNYVEAARLLGLHPNNLYRLIRNLNLKSRLKKQP